MKRKGLIFLFILIVLILPNLVFASDLNDNIILEEVSVESGGKIISWELKENVSPGSYFLLANDFSLDNYNVEKDDFLELELVEDSNLIKLIFTEKLEKGQEGSVSFVEIEEVAENIEVPLSKGKNTCDMCNKELTVIEDGRLVCICEEAVIIDLDDMPLKSEQIEDNEIASNESIDEENNENIQELEKSENKNDKMEISENIISESPKTLPNTGFSQKSIILGVLFLFFGFYFKKKLIFK